MGIKVLCSVFTPEITAAMPEYKPLARDDPDAGTTTYVGVDGETATPPSGRAGAGGASSAGDSDGDGRAERNTKSVLESFQEQARREERGSNADGYAASPPSGALPSSTRKRKRRGSVVELLDELTSADPIRGGW